MAIIAFPTSSGKIVFVENSKFSPAIIAFAFILVIFIFTYYVCSLIAFFHYVVYDSIDRSYSHFYVNFMQIMTVSVFVLDVVFLGVFLGSSTPNANEKAVVGLMIGFDLVFLVLLFLWARQLQQQMPDLKTEPVPQEEIELSVEAKEEVVQPHPPTETKREKPKQTAVVEPTMIPVPTEPVPDTENVKMDS